MESEAICPHCNEPFDESGDWGKGEDHYCIDCWPGYDLCADSNCGHYRCEHNIRTGSAIYVKPGYEGPTGPIDIDGCANYGCKCRKFQERK
jgi:hypothetical protein